MPAPAPYHPRPEWAEHIARLVAEAPPLSPDQQCRLAALLQTAPTPRKQTKDDPVQT